MYDIGCRNVAFTHPTKSLNDGSFRTTLQVLCNVVLNGGGFWEAKVFPHQEEKVSEVLQLGRNLHLVCYCLKGQAL